MTTLTFVFLVVNFNRISSDTVVNSGGRALGPLASGTVALTTALVDDQPSRSLAQTKLHVDFDFTFHRLAVHPKRRVDPLSDRIHGRLL